MNAEGVMMVTLSLLPISVHLNRDNMLQKRWGHQVFYRLPYTNRDKVNIFGNDILKVY